MPLTTGLQLYPGTDPTGNNMETLAVYYIAADGTAKRSGVYLCVHNSDGPVVVFAPADADPGYNLTQTAQGVTLPAGSLQVLVQS